MRETQQASSFKKQKAYFWEVTTVEKERKPRDTESKLKSIHALLLNSLTILKRSLSEFKFRLHKINSTCTKAKCEFTDFIGNLLNFLFR